MTVRRFLLFASQPYALSILQPVADAARARGDEVRWFLWQMQAGVLPADETVLTDPQQVRSFNPQAVFSASNWVPLVFPGLKVQLFHGFNAEKRNAAKGHFRIRGMFDLYCTQGPATTGPFEALAGQHGYFKVAETGWSKLDPLFADAPVAADMRFDNDKPVILFASTFTPALSAAEPLYDTLRQLIAEGRYNWLLTLHPKMAPQTVARYRALNAPNARFFTSERTLDLLRAADVMVCDTSSIIAEFQLQNRPAVTLRNRKPGPWLIDIDQPQALPAALEQALQADEVLMHAIRERNNQLHPLRDGLSSQRILQAVDNFENLAPPLTRSRPLNLRRKLSHWLKLRKTQTAGSR
ncbi:CDP-glycerol glycerophosphotransferase family protein [Granulosicoccaceae sp. 1_MG-2023]|nr:CDP-glycerol glycerophosphotransferase family protein [Granulosicoccaceae sp. 1_MG-2023]